MRATAQKLVILAKAERKQSITLGVLILFGIGFWARAAIKPNSIASAATSEDTAATATEFREPGSNTPEKLRIVVSGADPLTRDLFLPRPEDFPPPVQTDPSLGDGAKSADRSDDNTLGANTLPRLTVEERVLQESQRLTLRSTVVGAEPIAVVEVKRTGSPERVILRTGDTVLGFTLVRVVNRRAVFEKEGIEVTLALPMH